MGLMQRPNSDGHIQQRLNLRVEDPKKGSYEELESYLHPAYYIAIKKLRDAYETEYQDHVGKDIIETIAKGRPPKPPLKDTITSYFKRLVSSRLNLASAGGRAR